MQIGEILKEQREAKNISLDDLQAETKIQKRYLVAIEENDFQALPGKFYARAFIKEYALEVGLDPEEILEGFDEEAIEPDEPAPQYTRMDRARQSRNAKSSSFLSSLPTIIVVVLIIGIIFVAWLLITQKSNTSNNEDPNNQTENEEIIRDKPSNDQNENNNDLMNDDNDYDSATQDESGNDDNESDENDDEDDAEFSVVEEGTGDFPESTLDFTYPGDDVEVEFDVSEDTYIEFQGEDGESYLAETVSTDDDSDTYEVTDDEEIYIKVGNAKGVKILMNDVELDYPVDTETVTQKMRVNLKKAD